MNIRWKFSHATDASDMSDEDYVSIGDRGCLPSIGQFHVELSVMNDWSSVCSLHFLR